MRYITAIIIAMVPWAQVMAQVKIPWVEVAQSNGQAQTTSVIDQAIETARQRQREISAIAPLENIPMGRDKAKSRDITQMAADYQDARNLVIEGKRQLLVFVSTSIPDTTLEIMAHDVHRTGGIMILRGIKGELVVKNAMLATMKHLEKAAKTGVAIQIDPMSFRKFSINKVPAFVVTEQANDCNVHVCTEEYQVIYGDVSLAYALEAMIKGGGPHATDASYFLNKLSNR